MFALNKAKWISYVCMYYFWCVVVISLRNMYVVCHYIFWIIFHLFQKASHILLSIWQQSALSRQSHWSFLCWTFKGFVSPLRVYWVGQKVLPGFLLRCNGETSDEFLCQPNSNSKSLRVCKQFNFFQCALTCMEIVNCICHCSSVVQW